MTWMPRWLRGGLCAVLSCLPITNTASASDHDDASVALTYLCSSEEIDVDIELYDAASASLRLQADLFPYCLTTVDASHCVDETCRESVLDACLSNTVLAWAFGDGDGQDGGASATHSYGRAGDFHIDVGIRSGNSTLPGARCELTLRPTQVAWSIDVMHPESPQALVPGDWFEILVSVATTVGVGTVQDFGFVMPGQLSVDTRLFSIVSSPGATATVADVGPGEGIWSGRYIIEVLAEGAGYVALPMRYRANGDVTVATARKRVVIGPDPLGAVLPIMQFLLGTP